MTGIPDPLKYILEGLEPQAPEPRDPEPKTPQHLGDIITEDSVALAFAGMFADRLRYCHSTGSWFEWDGSIWRQNHDGRAFQFARELVRHLSATEKAKVRYIASKTSFASGVEKFARSDPVFAVTAEVWDRDPLLLGTPDGTVDLTTGIIHPSKPSNGITRQTRVALALIADCPRWIRFLKESTGGDDDLIRFLQQWCGYSLTGQTMEHALVFIHGPGGNGKGVFLNAVTTILGTYAAIAAMDTFTASSHDKHPTDLAMLRGARLVSASETEEGKPWAEARIKQITGGDPISARFMRQDFFTYTPQFKLMIVGNHQPVLKNVDDAARRRFNIVPFVLKPEYPDPHLEMTMRLEYPQILRWMIEGCLDWQKNGLVRPASVVAATEDYFGEQDLFSQWLEEECDVEPANHHKMESTTVLFGSWSNYARAAGEEPGTSKSFAPAMRRRGLMQKRTKAFRGWLGVRLQSEASYRAVTR